MTARPAAGRLAPPPPGRAPRSAPPRAPGWGWLELTVLAQTALPALMFVPGMSPLRVPLRIAAFAVTLAAWAAIFASGRRAAGRRFPAVPWLVACGAWMVLEIAHPTTNSLMSGLAHAAMNLAVMAPALWAPAAVTSTAQIRRLLGLLLACNVASAGVGILQARYPGRFDPPVIPMLQGQRASIRGELSFIDDQGRQVLRPCGLTDNPGGAAGAGSVACLIGLAWALRPMRLWRRLACFGAAVIGLAAVYYGQVRSLLLMQAVGVAVLGGMLLLRRDYRKAGLLAALTVVLVVAATAWVLNSGGSGVMRRFATLMEGRPGEVFYKNRGSHVEGSLLAAWHYPLGLGMGRWGQAYQYFGDPGRELRNGVIWIEVQIGAWAIDGGIPLLLGYSIAILAAVANTVGIVLRSRDEELAFSGAVLCAINISVLTACFASVPFISAGGIQFWAMVAALHGADQAGRIATARRAARARWASAARPGPGR